MRSTPPQVLEIPRSSMPALMAEASSPLAARTPMVEARRETPVASGASDDDDDDDDERSVPTRAARTTTTRHLGADVDDTAGAVPMRPGDARARPMRAPRGAVPRATDIITRRAKWASGVDDEASWPALRRCLPNAAF